MTSQIRVDEITNRSGLGTVTIYDNGFEFTGVTTFTENVDIEGNLTVGGALTYEDTTNIDSVGVITARAGINISGGNLQVGGTNVINSGRVLYNLEQIKLADAKELVLGSGNDLKIQHSGSHSFISQEGVGALKIKGDDIRFEDAGGTEALRIDDVGRLLIGRTSVLASSAERLTINDGMAMFRRSSTNAAAVYIRNEDSTADTRNPYLIFTDGSGNRGGFGIQNDQSSLWISGQNGIAFRTSGSAPSQEERLRITSGGNVGINDNNPSYKLSVNNGTTDSMVAKFYNDEVGINFGSYGTGSSYPREAVINGTRYDSGSSPYLRVAGQGGIKFCVDLNNERMRIDSSGRIGINETSPSHVLDVKSQAAGTYFINGQNHNGNNIFQVYESSDGDGNHGMIYLNNGSGTTVTKISTNGASYFNGGNIGMGGITVPSFTTGGGIHLKRNFGIGFGDGSNGRPDFQIASPNGSSLDFRCGFGADTADISMTTGGNLVFANGGGIDFSATPNSYGTMSSEVLDDYEEGTWTPVMNKSGVGGVVSSPSAAVGFYRKVGKLLWITFYWYKSSGGFGNNAGEWYVSGLPYLLAHQIGGAYQFISGGYNNINGTNYQNQSNRWQSNSTNGSATLAMYGPNSTTNWTSGYAEFSATGCLMVPLSWLLYIFLMCVTI